MTPNLSYTFGQSTTPLLGQTIGENLAKSVREYGDRTILVDLQHQVQMTYREFWEATTRVAKALLTMGIKPGDRIGLWSPNRYEWVVIQFATSRIGVILVNLNPAYRKKELIYIAKTAGIRMFIAATEYRNSDYVSMLAKVRRKLPQVDYVQYLDNTWPDFTESGAAFPDSDLAAIEAQVQFDDPINIQFTSGTTGFPKGVTLSHFNLLNNGYFIGERLGYTQQDKVCIPVPFFHCFGMVIGNLSIVSHGASIVIPGEIFNPEETLRAVEQQRCTSLYGVPTMFIAELQLPNFHEFDLSSLRTGVMAGSPCPVEIMKQVQSKMNMHEVSVCYGMTETSPVSTQTRVDVPLEKRVSTVGTVMDHLEIKIVDQTSGRIVPRGAEGEVCTRGYSVMLGYWNNPEATAQVIDSGRWMHTGDLGTMDEEGFVAITGRSKDLIIRGGENVSPREIEEYLYTHENVEDVQVIGVPDEKFGEEIMAWVKPIRGTQLTEDDLKHFCRNQIAHYKIPKYWKFVDSFPMTVSGKVRKVEMREIAIKELKL